MALGPILLELRRASRNFSWLGVHHVRRLETGTARHAAFSISGYGELVVGASFLLLGRPLMATINYPSAERRARWTMGMVHGALEASLWV
jgi:hypothetical protein